METLKKLTVEDVVLRERRDGSEKFPAVIISGVHFHESETGTQSFTKRRVSLPVNGLSMQEAEAFFPIGMELEGYEIIATETEPYEWQTPTGEWRTDTVRYRLRKMGTERTEKPHVQANGHTMESQVFAELS